MSRQPLSEFFNDSNHKGGVEGRFESMPNWRFGSVGRADCGQCPKAIAGELGIPPTAVMTADRLCTWK